MKVLFVGHTYIVRVNQHKLYALAQMPDVELFLVVPRVWDDYIRRIEVELDGGEPFNVLPLSVLRQGRETRYMYFPDITMGIRKVQPDIIHVEQGQWALAYAQAIFMKRLFAPSAKTVFFTWWNLEYNLSPPAWLVERFNFTGSDYAIAGNADAAALLCSHGFTGPIALLPQLGVDPDLFRPTNVRQLREQLGLMDCFVVGFVGRFIEQKGLSDLVAAVTHLPSHAHLLIVGRGELRSGIERQATILGVLDRVHFIDSVPHDQVPLYLNVMDVLVLPSRTTSYWKEQFGHVLVEAMACETSVVGSDSGEIPNVIGDAGLIFPEGDVEALADAIGRLMRDDGLRHDLGHRGRERVLQHYTHQCIAEKTIAIWRELLQE